MTNEHAQITHHEIDRVSERRSEVAIDQLKISEVFTPEQLQTETSISLARIALHDYKIQAEEKVKRQTKDKGLVVKTDKDVTIAESWVEGASDEEMQELFDKLGLKTPARHNFEDRVLRVFKSYSNLKLENQRALLKKPEAAIEAYRWNEADSKDLFDTIFDLLDHPKIDKTYVEGLMLFFDIAIVKNPNVRRKDLVLRHTLPRLRDDARKYKIDETTTPLVREGVQHVKDLVGMRHSSVKTIPELVAERYVHDDIILTDEDRRENIVRTESIVAHGIAAIYHQASSEEL
jgi:hypothetical protein